jgi:hypothetical protein
MIAPTLACLPLLTTALTSCATSRRALRRTCDAPDACRSGHHRSARSALGGASCWTVVVTGNAGGRGARRGDRRVRSLAELRISRRARLMARPAPGSGRLRARSARRANRRSGNVPQCDHAGAAAPSYDAAHDRRLRDGFTTVAFGKGAFAQAWLASVGGRFFTSRVTRARREAAAALGAEVISDPRVLLLRVGLAPETRLSTPTAITSGSRARSSRRRPRTCLSGLRRLRFPRSAPAATRPHRSQVRAQTPVAAFRNSLDEREESPPWWRGRSYAREGSLSDRGSGVCSGHAKGALCVKRSPQVQEW